jgi:hypothetical protein
LLRWRRGFIMVARESDGTPMAKLFICRLCVAELARVELADGTAALVCVDCDAIGLAHEIVHGAPMWPAGLPVDARASDKRRSRRRARRQGAADGR